MQSFEVSEHFSLLLECIVMKSMLPPGCRKPRNVQTRRIKRGNFFLAENGIARASKARSKDKDEIILGYKEN